MYQKWLTDTGFYDSPITHTQQDSIKSLVLQNCYVKGLSSNSKIVENLMESKMENEVNADSDSGKEIYIS